MAFSSSSSSSSRSMLSAIRNTFVASHLTSYFAATAGASAAAAPPLRRNMSAAAAAAGQHQLITVELISDTMWPNGFIGKRHLQNAMNEVMRAPVDPTNPLRFSVLRVPFFLEPNYERSEDWHETNRVRLERKWGGKAAFAAQKHRHRLKERGQEVGIEHFNLDRLASNTLASHRLVQWVTKNYGCGVSEALYNDLNHRHFVDGQRLNDREMLCEAAANAGVDRARCAEFLASDEGYAEIKNTQEMLTRLGIHSIPNFVIGGEFVVSGAVHSAELVEIFRGIEKKGVGAPGSAFAETLQIPEKMRTVPLPAPEDAPRQQEL